MMLKSNYNWQFTGEDVSFDQLAEAGVYFLGDPDLVADQLKEFMTPRAVSDAADRHRQGSATRENAPHR